MWGECEPPSIEQGIREWIWWVGQEPRFKDCQWILSDYDTWEQNPHYRGPEQRHPEDPSRWEDDYFADGTPVSLYDNIHLFRSRV